MALGKDKICTEKRVEISISSHLASVFLVKDTLLRLSFAWISLFYVSSQLASLFIPKLLK